VAPIRVVSIVGHKNAGKTTLTVALAAEFVRQGHRVGTIRHSEQATPVDTYDKDTWRHFHEGHASAVLFSAPGFRALFERADGAPADLSSLVRRYHPQSDIVIVEGLADPATPRIEVHRRKLEPRPTFDPATSDPTRWIALLTDDDTLDVPFPTFRYTDTAWLVTLAAMAWQRAMLVTG
jgi:molybdopterin-guanine dinucleotide biosynthesis protein MobB